MSPDLPPEFEPILSELAAAPGNVRAMWKYAMVLMMIDDEKARVVAARREGATQFLIVQTIAGDRFEIERPEMSEETEQMLLEQIREIASEERR